MNKSTPPQSVIFLVTLRPLRIRDPVVVGADAAPAAGGRVQPVHDLGLAEPEAAVRRPGVDAPHGACGVIALDVLVPHHDDQPAQVEAPGGDLVGQGR
jgi:hypothetical protein